MELQQYALKVQAMRFAQRSFAKAAEKGNKEKKKIYYDCKVQLEKEVDQLTREILAS